MRPPLFLPVGSLVAVSSSADSTFIRESDSFFVMHSAADMFWIHVWDKDSWEVDMI